MSDSPLRPTSALTRLRARGCQGFLNDAGEHVVLSPGEAVYLASEVDAAFKESRAQFITAERLRREDGASYINEQIEHAEQVKLLRAEVERLTRELEELNGTPAARLHGLFVLLQQRFQDPEPNSGKGYEGRFLAWLDTLTRERDEARRQLSERTPVADCAVDPVAGARGDGPTRAPSSSDT